MIVLLRDISVKDIKRMGLRRLRSDLKSGLRYNLCRNHKDSDGYCLLTDEECTAILGAPLASTDQGYLDMGKRDSQITSMVWVDGVKVPAVLVQSRDEAQTKLKSETKRMQGIAPDGSTYVGVGMRGDYYVFVQYKDLPDGSSYSVDSLDVFDHVKDSIGVSTACKEYRSYVEAVQDCGTVDIIPHTSWWRAVDSRTCTAYKGMFPITDSDFISAFQGNRLHTSYYRRAWGTVSDSDLRIIDGFFDNIASALGIGKKGNMVLFAWTQQADPLFVIPSGSDKGYWTFNDDNKLVKVDDLTKVGGLVPLGTPTAEKYEKRFADFLKKVGVNSGRGFSGDVANNTNSKTDEKKLTRTLLKSIVEAGLEAVSKDKVTFERDFTDIGIDASLEMAPGTSSTGRPVVKISLGNREVVYPVTIGSDVVLGWVLDQRVLPKNLPDSVLPPYTRDNIQRLYDSYCEKYEMSPYREGPDGTYWRIVPVFGENGIGFDSSTGVPCEACGGGESGVLQPSIYLVEFTPDDGVLSWEDVYAHPELIVNTLSLEDDPLYGVNVPEDVLRLRKSDLFR